MECILFLPLSPLRGSHWDLFCPSIISGSVIILNGAPTGRHAAKHPTMYTIVTQNKEASCPKCQ